MSKVKGRHGLTTEQIHELARFQNFKCALSGFELKVVEV